MNKDRELCVRKDVTKTRDVKRIPVICDLIEQLWEKQREHYDDSIGFYCVTNLLEIAANDEKEQNGDPFQWEEDKWYDLIVSLIEYSEQAPKKTELPPEEVYNMKQTVGFFQEYWCAHQDLRLQQFINIFNTMFEAKIRNFKVTDVNFWRNIFIPEQINVLESQRKQLEVIKNKIKEENKENTDLILKNIDSLAKTAEEKINELRTEYGYYD